MMLTSLLISCTIVSSVYQGCYGHSIINVASGVYSTKAESDGLGVFTFIKFIFLNKGIASS